jgi:hypothetical protein
VVFTVLDNLLFPQTSEKIIGIIGLAQHPAKLQKAMQQLVSENTNRFADNFGLNLTLIDILAL